MGNSNSDFKTYWRDNRYNSFVLNLYKTMTEEEEVQELKNQLGDELDEILRRDDSKIDKPNKYNYGATRKNSNYISLGHTKKEA